jgi:C-terminal processing protease CtpA/Prc
VTAAIRKYVVATKPDVEATNSEELERNEVVGFNQKWTTKEPFYKGKTVFLMYKTTQSEAEHVGMCLKSLGKTTFIGTPTIGANGTQTVFSIPGEVNLAFSAMNFSMSNGKPMERVGLQPDVYATPIIKGIQQGKDEVLDIWRLIFASCVAVTFAFYQEVGWEYVVSFPIFRANQKYKMGL